MSQTHQSVKAQQQVQDMLTVLLLAREEITRLINIQLYYTLCNTKTRAYVLSEHDSRTNIESSQHPLAYSTTLRVELIDH